jgi:hypothetical protein
VTHNLSTIQGLMPLLLMGALAFVVLGLRSRPATWWLVCAYLAGSAAAALLIGKIGSDVNYLLELSAALALAAGALISRYATRGALCSAPRPGGAGGDHGPGLPLLLRRAPG